MPWAVVACTSTSRPPFNSLLIGMSPWTKPPNFLFAVRCYAERFKFCIFVRMPFGCDVWKKSFEVIITSEHFSMGTVRATITSSNMKIYALFVRVPFATNPPDFFEEPATTASGESGWFLLKSHSLMQAGYCESKSFWPLTSLTMVVPHIIYESK